MKNRVFGLPMKFCGIISGAGEFQNERKVRDDIRSRDFQSRPCGIQLNGDSTFLARKPLLPDAGHYLIMNL
jgi:hypothetical protein